ncbi:MAG: deoxyribose-phosphate aldolase [Clostridia bacterium]|nr:deoxyribose-phosphate aldolase [Clostridia bacterium]
MQDLNRYIDHTLLKAEATPVQIEKLCSEALAYHFASVCVNTCYVPLCAHLLKGSDVAVCCVVGFPLGAMLIDAKAAETRLAVAAGAQEVDMVINVGMAKAGDWAYVQSDIRAVVEAAGTAHVKVILECCLLTDAEKERACACAMAAGAAFVKTSTGFSTGGATIEDVALMRRCVGPEMGVKAAGGVRTKEDALAIIQAGATRLGASAGIAIVTG